MKRYAFWIAPFLIIALFVSIFSCNVSNSKENEFTIKYSYYSTLFYKKDTVIIKNRVSLYDSVAKYNLLIHNKYEK